MKSLTFVAIRQGRDGSVYFHKKHTLRSVLHETVAIVIFLAIMLFVLALAIFQPPVTQAQQTNPLFGGSAITLTGFIAPAELEKTTLEDVLIKTTSLPSLWPIRGKLTAGFGVRRNPFRWKDTEFHTGQDIAAPKGTPICVTADGTVVFAGWKTGYGQVVIVDHGYNISTRYGHLSQIETTVGSTIKRGENIGLVGSTGRSTGPHLHYEVRVDNVPVNPRAYLPATPARNSSFTFPRIAGL